jgi:hypothetical protein
VEYADLSTRPFVRNAAALFAAAPLLRKVFLNDRNLRALDV